MIEWRESDLSHVGRSEDVSEFLDAQMAQISDVESEVLWIQSDVFDAFMSGSTDYRARLFDVCSNRITDLLLMIEDSLVSQRAAKVRLGEISAIQTFKKE